MTVHAYEVFKSVVAALLECYIVFIVLCIFFCDGRSISIYLLLMLCNRRYVLYLMFILG